MSFSRIYTAIQGLPSLSDHDRNIIFAVIAKAPFPTVANARVAAKLLPRNELGLTAEEKAVIETDKIQSMNNIFQQTLNEAIKQLPRQRQNIINKFCSQLIEIFNATNVPVSDAIDKIYEETNQAIKVKVLIDYMAERMQNEPLERLSELDTVLNTISQFSYKTGDDTSVSILISSASFASAHIEKDIEIKQKNMSDHAAVEALKSSSLEFVDVLALRIANKIPSQQVDEFIKSGELQKPIKQMNAEEKVEFVKTKYMTSFYVRAMEKAKTDDVNNLLICNRLIKLLSDKQPDADKLASFEVEYKKNFKEIKNDLATQKFMNKVKSVFKAIGKGLKHLAERPKYVVERLFKQHDKKTYADIPTVDSTNNTRHRP